MQALKNKNVVCLRKRHGLEGNFITEEHALSYGIGAKRRCVFFFGRIFTLLSLQ